MSYTGSFADDFLENAGGKRSTNRQQRLDDLRATLESPAGFRVLAAILKDMGLGGFMANDAGMIALRNEGERILRDIVEADSGNAIRLIAALRGIEI